MLTKLKHVFPFFSACLLLWGVVAAWSAPIVYKQTMTKILAENQFQGWPPGYETSDRYFNLLTNSLDGSRIAFRVSATVLGTTHVRTYVANSDGSGIIDLTDHFPPAVPPLTAVYYKLDDTGARLFFRAPNVGSDVNFYYFDLASRVCSLAVLPKTGETFAIRDFDARKPFSLTTSSGQTTLFFRHLQGWDPGAGRFIQGLYCAPLGGSATQVMDLSQLPGDPNLNLLGFLGSAANAGRTLFTWNQDFSNPPAGAMWQTAGPARIPDEVHGSVWDNQDLYTSLVSADGSKALYKYLDPPSSISYLSHVNLNTGVITPIAQTGNLNSYSAPAMAPSGHYAFFTSPFNQRTRVNLATGEQRDTLSSYFYPCSGPYLISDITADDRCYFIGGKCPADLGRIHRLDMAPTNFSQAPDITAINFTVNRLRHDGISRTTVTAAVSDAQGLHTITWVRLKSLVDGLELPEWLTGYEPLSYDWNLYDDGTHGDEKAGDGIYTNDTIRTNPACNFYQRFTLPKEVGVRLIVRDEDQNYVLADTCLTVVNDLSIPAVPLLLLD